MSSYEQESRARSGSRYFEPLMNDSVHCPRTARSASVIPVLLAGGIVRETNARSWMRGARDSICARVSNITPAGAGPKVTSVGRDEWQTAHRRSMMWRASSKFAGPEAVSATAGVEPRFMTHHSTMTLVAIVTVSAGFHEANVHRMLRM